MRVVSSTVMKRKNREGWWARVVFEDANGTRKNLVRKAPNRSAATDIRGRLVREVQETGGASLLHVANCEGVSDAINSSGLPSDYPACESASQTALVLSSAHALNLGSGLDRGTCIREVCLASSGTA